MSWVSRSIEVTHGNLNTVVFNLTAEQREGVWVIA